MPPPIAAHVSPLARALILACALLVLGVAPCGHAQQDRRGPGPPPRPGGPGPARGGDWERPRYPILALLDVDRDGRLSPEEMAAAPTRLRLLDENGDGKLSPREILAFRPPRSRVDEFDPVAFIDRVLGHDADGDGAVSRDELPDGLKRLVAQADANGDDAVSRAELEAMLKRFRKRVQLQ